MRVGCQDLHESFGKHALGPVFWSPSEFSKQRSRSNLHPDAAFGKALNKVILVLDPSQSLRMRKDRDVFGDQDVKE